MRRRLAITIIITAMIFAGCNKNKGVGERKTESVNNYVETTESSVELKTQMSTETQTEQTTQNSAEVQTEAETQEPTEIQTEAETQEPTEIQTEAETQIPTEPPTEVVTQMPTEPPTQAPAPTQNNNYFDKDIALAIWGYMNDERAEKGLNRLEWDESIYNFACQRAQTIVYDFSHNGCGIYGENILYSGISSNPYDLHMLWYNSSGHHENYLDGRYVSGACAVWVQDGICYAVENFLLGSVNPNDDNEVIEINGQNFILPSECADAYKSGKTYTASNGVMLIFVSDNRYYYLFGDDIAGEFAYNEYLANH